MYHHVIGEVLAPVVPDIGIVVVGMLALLLVLALALVIEFLKFLFSHAPDLPIIGSGVRDALNSAADSLWGVAGWLWNHCNPVAVWNGTMNILGSLWSNVIVRFATAVYSRFTVLVQQDIPNAANWALQQADNAVNALRSAIVGMLTAVITQLWQALSAVYAYVAAQVGALEAWTFGEIQQAEAVALHDLQAADSWTAAGLNDLEGRLSQGLNDLYHDITAGLQAIDNAEAALQAAVVAWVTSEVSSIAGSLSGDLNALRNWITSALVPSIAAAAALAAATAAKLAKLEEDCTTPMCNGFGQLLQDVTGLQSLMGDVAIAALLAELISDPAGFAAELNDLVIAPVRDIVTAATSAAGVNIAV
jgi:hypothetical protein